MRRINLILLILVFIAGCSDQPVQDTTDFIFAQGEVEQAGIFDGTIAVRTVGEFEIGVAFQNREVFLAPGMEFNEVYVFGSEEPVPSNLALDVEAGMIDFKPGDVTILSEDGATLLRLALTDVIEESTTMNTMVLAGYRVTRTLGAWSANQFNEKDANFFADIGAHNLFHALAASKGPGSCDGGGPGSQSCSVSGCAGTPSSCSTTCSSGYYACCNCYGSGASCTCVEE